MKEIGFVIVNYNDYETTKRLLDNIKDYDCLKKIVVVDNCSTDNSLEELNKIESKKIDIISNVSNKGYASGLNCGAKYLMNKLNNPIIVFSNSDIIINKEQDIVSLANDINRKIKVVGPVIEEKGNYNRGWKKTTPFVEILLNLPLISRYFKKTYLYYSDNYYRDNITYVDVVSGCLFLVDGKTLKEIGYFDENTFLYYEELILSSKIKSINKRIIVDNNVHVIHDHSQTIDKNVKRIRKYKILKQSQHYYVKKYLKANDLELTFLWLTNKLSLVILYIRGLFRN